MSEYGAQTLRPTRLLTNLSFPSQAWSHGWPTFEGDGKYSGPLFRVQAPVIPKNVKPSQASPSKLLAVMLRAFVADSQVSGSTSTKGGEFVNRGGRGKKRLLPPVEATVPQRWKVTEEQLVQLGQGVQLGEGAVYIGRGGRYGVPRSKWANPAKIGKDGDRDQVIKSFMTYAVKRGLDVDAGVELRGEDLLCHCDGDVDCHGDVLLRWANQTGTGQRTPRTMEEEASVEGDLQNDGLSGRFEEGGVGQEVSEEVASEGALGRLRHKGQPRKAWCFGKLRPFADGGGLCSPWRWPKDARAYLKGRWHGISDRLWQVFGSEVARLAFHDATDFAVRVAACRFGDCPFSESALAKARSVVSDALAVPKEEQEVASGQVVHLGLVKALLHEAGDPDSQLMDVLAAGVPIGVDGDMPRTPEVFEEKTNWSLNPDDAVLLDVTSNYKSVSGHEAEVEALFKEQEGLGWMEEITDGEAKTKFGKRLAVASLGAVEEKKGYGSSMMGVTAWV